MPNKERIQLLIDALKTTKRTQGTGRLATKFGKSRKWSYCCLGIACEVAIKHGLPLQRKEFPAGTAVIKSAIEYSNPKAPGYDGSSTKLPKAVADWYGLNSDNPGLLDENGARVFATELNDVRGYSFKQIAKAFQRTFLNNNS